MGIQFGKWCLMSVCAIGVLAFSGGSPAQSASSIFNMGTGGITGIFWQTGGFVCNLLNKSRKTQGHKVRCTVESTAGSVGNIRAVGNGDLDMGMAQANLLFHAYRGTGAFKKESANKKLRFLMSFTTNSLQIVTRKDTGIKSVRDLAGKRVNTGNAGSGTEATSYLVLPYYGIDAKKDLAFESKLTSREQSSALCDGKIDAYLYPTGVGVAAITEAANTCDIDIVPLGGPELDKLVSEHPYFQKTTVPAGAYKGVDHDTSTFGYSASLFTTSDLPDDVGYQLVKAVMNGFDGFKGQGLAYEAMTRKNSATAGQTAPYHSGAERYLREAKLIK